MVVVARVWNWVSILPNVSILPREGKVQGIRETCWVCGSEILVIKKASCGGQIIGCFRHTREAVGEGKLKTYQ